MGRGVEVAIRTEQVSNLLNKPHFQPKQKPSLKLRRSRLMACSPHLVQLLSKIPTKAAHLLAVFVIGFLPWDEQPPALSLGDTPGFLTRDEQTPSFFSDLPPCPKRASALPRGRSQPLLSHQSEAATHMVEGNPFRKGKAWTKSTKACLGLLPFSPGEVETAGCFGATSFRPSWHLPAKLTGVFAIPKHCHSRDT